MKRIFYAIVSCALLTYGCKENEKKGEKLLDSDPMAKTAVPAEPQKPKLSIHPIEHATVVLSWGNLTIYVDPVGGAAAFEGQKDPDLILISDIHGDHFDLETLKALNTEKVKIMVPQAVADKMGAEFAAQIDVLNNGDRIERFGVRIEAIPMYNLREEAKDFHIKGRGNGYVLHLGDESIYFSGDTEDIPEMRALENIDIAFICMNLPYTMTEESAANAVLAFRPKKVYPYHYRGRPDVSDVAKFKALVTAGNPNIEVIQLDWYPNDDF